MSQNIIRSITDKEAGVKLVNFLKFELNFSTRLTRRITKEERVLVNGENKRNSYQLIEGDVVEIIVNNNETQNIEPQDIPIDAAYEDDDVLIVNKPPFMVVHPTRSHPFDTLANAVINYFNKTNQNCIVRLVNRLDRDTSGLVMIAKSQYAHQGMAKKLDDNLIQKYYIAVVEGKLEGSGTIDLPIDRPTEDSIKREVMENGQRAVTHYETLTSGDKMSSVLIRLETGRTHQIRVHMQKINHPIVGDSLYGNESELINRQALHAYKLKFNTLRDDNEIEVTAKVPDDIQKLLYIIEKNKI